MREPKLVADKDDKLLKVLDEYGNFTGKYEKIGYVHDYELF